MISVGHVAYIKETGNEYKILVKETERKRPIGRTRHRWEVISKWFLEK
jgi:hypothetical protein